MTSPQDVSAIPLGKCSVSLSHAWDAVVLQIELQAASRDPSKADTAPPPTTFVLDQAQALHLVRLLTNCLQELVSGPPADCPAH